MPKVMVLGSGALGGSFCHEGPLMDGIRVFRKGAQENFLTLPHRRIHGDVCDWEVFPHLTMLLP